MAPLISSLMVTLPIPQRFEGLKSSIADFVAQTHPEKELVIVMNGGESGARHAIALHVAALGDPRIRLQDVPDRRTLGALRNISLAEARGSYVCQWDDDDRHHPQRLEMQLGGLARIDRAAIILEEVVQFFQAEQSLYCLNWRATEAKGFPGSLFCRSEAHIRYPEAGETASRGEDLSIVKTLQKEGAIGVLPSSAHLYVYVSHGQNTWADSHHRMLAKTLAVSKGMLTRREADLRSGLRPFEAFLGHAAVNGSNGTAFTL